MAGSVAVSPAAGGSLAASLAGDSLLAGEISPAGGSSLAGDFSLGGVVDADGASGAPSWCTCWGCSAPTQKQQLCINNEKKKSSHARQTAGVSHILTLGAALRAALRICCRVRQGRLWHDPACRGRFVLKDDQRDPGPLHPSLGQSPEKGTDSEEGGQAADQDEATKNASCA